MEKMVGVLGWNNQSKHPTNRIELNRIESDFYSGNDSFSSGVGIQTSLNGFSW